VLFGPVQTPQTVSASCIASRSATATVPWVINVAYARVRSTVSAVERTPVDGTPGKLAPHGFPTGDLCHELKLRRRIRSERIALAEDVDLGREHGLVRRAVLDAAVGSRRDIVAGRRDLQAVALVICGALNHEHRLRIEREDGVAADDAELGKARDHLLRDRNDELLHGARPHRRHRADRRAGVILAALMPDSSELRGEIRARLAEEAVENCDRLHEAVDLPELERRRREERGGR